jgi:hypothetical protein
MKTYSVLFALDIPHYGSVDIEAPDDTAALAAAKQLDPSDYTSDPAWDDPICRRIVHIEAPDGRIVSRDVNLDEFFLRRGGEEARRLCDGAPALKEALEEIAAIPLCGEPIANADLKRDLALQSEYDLEFDEFEPSCDTESSHLRDAVETARAALALLSG